MVAATPLLWGLAQTVPIQYGAMSNDWTPDDRNCSRTTASTGPVGHIGDVFNTTAMEDATTANTGSVGQIGDMSNTTAIEDSTTASTGLLDHIGDMLNMTATEDVMTTSA